MSADIRRTDPPPPVPTPHPRQPTFLDYVQAHPAQLHRGCRLHGLQRPPTDSRSLHYRDPRGADNQYMTAIRSVGDIIQDYDSGG